MNVTGLPQRFSWCAKGGYLQDLFQAPAHFVFSVCKKMANVNSKQHVLSVDWDRIKSWMKIIW